MALYGSIPYMVAHNSHKTVGVFWNNAAETWIDIASSKSVLNSLISFFKTGDVPEVDTHWMSESGIIDLFVMLGPKPFDVSSQYSSLTGTQTLPPVSVSSFHLTRKCSIFLSSRLYRSISYLSSFVLFRDPVSIAISKFGVCGICQCRPPKIARPIGSGRVSGAQNIIRGPIYRART